MRIILCVTNDIEADQRIHRISCSLSKVFSDVKIVGVELPFSKTLYTQKYKTFRFRLLFRKGPLFYIEYNLRLFFYLLFIKTDVIVANDLDSLLAAFVASRIRNKCIVYDSHEYFTQLPELINRKHVRNTWQLIESIILPRIKYSYTVCESIAEEYNNKYHTNMVVIRNVPYRLNISDIARPNNLSNKKIIIYQGSLNMGRGIEKAICAMQYIHDAHLIIAGTGYMEKELKQLAEKLNVKEKVEFTGRLMPDILSCYTVYSQIGISLEEPLGLSYYYSLPNKLFDYIQAEIPVVVSDMPEMSSLVKKYGVGRIFNDPDPFSLALLLTEMLNDDLQRLVWKANLSNAAKELCWENEEEKLMDVYEPILDDLNHHQK